MKKLVAFIIVLVILISCRKEKTYWDVDIVSPVATSSLSLSNLFPDTLLETNADGSLQIAFQSDLFSLNADTLLKLPDTTFANVYAPIMFPFGYFTYFPNDNFNFLPNSEVRFDIASGIELKEATIHSGMLHLEIKNPLRQPTIFTCSVSSAKLNSVPLSVSLNVPAGTQTNPAYRDTFIDITNYHVDFTGSGGNKTNTILQSLAIKIAPTASPDTLKYGDSIKSYITFIDLIPQFGRGYFGNQSITLPLDTMMFNEFNQLQSGSLGLDSANIKLYITNDFGIDLRAKIDTLGSISPQNGTINLTGPGTTSPFNVGRSTAIANGSSPVIPYLKTLTYTNLNSNVTQFIGNLPRSISYKMTAQLNPLGNVSGYNDFVYYGTALKAKLDAKVPLRFSTNNLSLRDTTEFNISALSDEVNVINEGKLKLRANNSYPFDLGLTAMLLDEYNNPIEPIIIGPDNIIFSPLLDANGISIGSKETWLEIPFDKGKLESMLKARKIAYYITFNTPNPPAVATFLNTYRLDLLLTVDFNYSVNK